MSFLIQFNKIQLIEWLELKRSKMLYVDDDVNICNSHIWNLNSTPLWNTFQQFSYKVTHVLLVQLASSRNFPSKSFPKRNKNSYSHKGLYTFIYSSFIHNSKNKTERNQIYSHYWLDKQTVANPYILNQKGRYYW